MVSDVRIGKTLITADPGRGYTRIGADYLPPLACDHAREAGELVLRGAEETLDLGRLRALQARGRPREGRGDTSGTFGFA